MYNIGKMPGSIDIGFTGETNFRKIEIDMTAWMKETPDGVPSIIHVRPGEADSDAYVAVTTFDTETNVLTWIITAADIGTRAGEGDIQIWLEVAEDDEITKRGKSKHVKSIVSKAANNPDQTAPTSQEAFLEQVTEVKTLTLAAKDDAVIAKNAAEAAADAAEAVNLHPAYIDETTLCWMVWSKQTGEYVNTGVYASGDPEILIDDTAGEGDTNKTWSADKFLTEISDLNRSMADKVDDWLEENITNPDSPPLDRSLTSNASAAPADIAGNLKNSLNGEAHTLYEKGISLAWYQGSIGSNGKNNASNSRCRTDMLSLGEHDLIIFKPSTFLYYIVEYSSTSINDFVAVITPLWLSGDYVLAPVKNHYYRLVVKKPDDSDFTPSDPLLANISLSYAKDLNKTILDIWETVAIPANSDLNDYIVPGRYSSQNTANTRTLDNCPVSTTGFDLIVTKTSGHSGASDIYVRQLLMLNAPDTNYYYTRYIAQSYGEWQKISFEDDWSHNVFEPDSSALPARITGTEKKTINVCTFNVARYRHSNKDYLSEKPDFMMCLRRYIMNGEIDILFTQEHLDYIDGSETKPSFDWLYKSFFNADPVNSGEYASEAHKKIFTTLPISTDGTVEYVECYAQPEIAGIYSKAYFVWVLQELQGIGTLLLIDVHNFASAQANSANTWKPLESRKKYLEALATFLAAKTYDYCIIAGDFNSGNDEGLDSSGKKVPCDTPEDFEAILNFCSDNNMHPVNGGKIGWFKTSTQLAYDNILVTNNIRIEKIESDNETRKELYSDHSPILAKLTFIDIA